MMNLVNDIFGGGSSNGRNAPLPMSTEQMGLGSNGDSNPNRAGAGVLSGDPSQSGLGTLGSGSNDTTIGPSLKMPKAFDQPVGGGGAPTQPTGSPASPTRAAAPAPGPLPSQGGMPLSGSPPSPEAMTTDGVPMPPERARANPEPGDMEMPQDPTQILDIIAAKEGTSDDAAKAAGYKSGYDVTLGYGRFDPRDESGQPLSKTQPPSQMTLDQVDALQTAMLNNPGNSFNASPVGRYQIVRTTLRSLREQMGLSGDEIFTPELQDRMARRLMRDADYAGFMAGEISGGVFYRNLSKIWEGLKTGGGVGPATTDRPANVGSYNSGAEQSSIANDEMQRLYQQMLENPPQQTPVRSGLEQAIVTGARFGTGDPRTRDWGKISQGVEQEDIARQNQNDSEAQAYMQRISSMAQGQRKWLVDQYDYMRRQADADEQKVLDVADNIFGDQKDKIAMVLGELGSDPAMADRLATLGPTQLVRVIRDKAEEMGISIKKDLTEAEIADIRSTEAKTAETLAELEGGNDGHWTDRLPVNPTAKDKYFQSEVRVKRGIENAQSLVEKIGANAEAVGSTGNIASITDGLLYTAQNVGEIFFNLDQQDEIPEGFRRTVDRLAAKDRDLSAIYQALVFSVAKTMDPSGRLSNDDVRRASLVLGDPDSWLSSPNKLKAQLVSGYGTVLDNEWALLRERYESATGGEYPIAKPSDQIREMLGGAINSDTGGSAKIDVTGTTGEVTTVNVDTFTGDIAKAIKDAAVGTVFVRNGKRYEKAEDGLLDPIDE